MRRVSLTGASTGLRARRWDVLVLGGALPGLAAAIRLGMAGLRVLVVEEEAAAATPALLREPFSLAGSAPGGGLDACLRALGLPAIDRRGLQSEEIAHQVLLPGARVDVAAAARTAEELVAWGLAKPELARSLMRGLESAARAECEAMLTSAVIRRGLRRGDVPGRERARHGKLPRGLPEAAANPAPELALFLDAQVRALSNLGLQEPGPEARSRLLGFALEGGATFRAPGNGLRDLLERRIRTLHGELRRISGAFELVQIGGHPGLVPLGCGEAWLGRAMLLNVPLATLGATLEAWGQRRPGFLKGPVASRRRAAVLLRAAAEVVPEAMASRAILVGGNDAAGAISIALHPSRAGAGFLELVASRVVAEDASLAEAEDTLESSVAELLPFSEGRVERVASGPRPRWDDADALLDPARGRGWPGEVDIRAGRQPVYALRREGIAGLGLEGDLLLGWRAGDAIGAGF